ncbi:MAG: hypothetical protein WB791_06025 [Waddliaceae bacterium]
MDNQRCGVENVVIKNDIKERNVSCKESEILKLKRLILIFKKKYQCALQDLAKKEKNLFPEESDAAKKYRDLEEENAALSGQQMVLKELLRKAQKELEHANKRLNHDGEGEKECDHLREKLRETYEANKNQDEQMNMLEASFRKEKLSAESEIAAAKEKIAALENNRSAVEEENRILSHRVEKLVAIVKEQEKRLSELQRYEYSFRKMGNFNQKLEEDCEELKRALQQVRLEKEMLTASLEERCRQLSQLEETRESLQKREEEAGAARKKVEVQEQELAQMKQQVKEIEEKLGYQEKEKQDVEKKLEKETAERRECQRGREELKQALIQAVCETREVKRLYQNIAGEKAGGLKKISHMQHRLQEAREELEAKEREIGKLNKRIDLERKEQEELKKQLAQQLEERRESGQRIQQKEKSLLSLTEQIKTLQSQQTHSQHHIQEKEERILEAQHHLAKKVKEVSQLKEAIEEQHRQLAGFQEELSLSQEKTDQSEKTMKAYQEEKEKQEEKMIQWEKKYLKIAEKWEECKAQNQELKKIRTKYEQLQQLLTKLGDAVDSPLSFPRSISTAVEKPSHPSSEEAQKQQMKNSYAEQTLFDREKSQAKYKKDLFSQS